MSYFTDPPKRNEVIRLPPLPSNLVQSTALEVYLQALNMQLTAQLSLLSTQLSDAQERVKSVETNMRLTRKLLRELMLLVVKDKVRGGKEGEDLELLLPEFVSKTFADCESHSMPSLPSTGEGRADDKDDIKDKFLFLNKINDERLELCRRRDDEECRFHEQRLAAANRIEEMCRELEEVQSAHVNRVERISYWLNPIAGYGSPMSGCEEACSGGGSDGGSCERTGDEEIVRELHETICNAPLFLEFRRILLRDVSERMAVALDQHSVHSGNVKVISTFNCDGLDRGPKRFDANYFGDVDGGVSFPPTDSAGLAEQRLRMCNNGYVRFSDVQALLKKKQDAAPFAKRVSEACSKDIDAQLLERLEDLEERMKMFEAERKELHNILSTVVEGWRQKQGVGNPLRGALLSTHTTKGGNVPQQRSLTTRLFDLSDLRNFASDGSTPKTALGAAASSVRSPAGAAAVGGSCRQCPAKSFKQAPSSVASPRRPEAGSEVARRFPQQDPGVLTANQEAYLLHVVGKKGQADVETLPALPYERHAPK
ncbi:unnamed protein product [Trypanosoma congolense IL3000]|uniref:WGS project CAEQ00000000 data, annotated contig 1013 n=1 Tax=Trypanosoma congolense (strain IL3000) TaxID=1068625 RepID=F9W376_TRYCI|nr:unnamed protein product [Trypanosoma congolense IL3000]